jgi:hypothetical protein
MKFRKSDERYESILDTNSAHIEELPVEEKPQMSPEERKKVLTAIVSAVAALVLVAGVITVGILVGQKQELREPRESTPTFYGQFEEDAEDGIVDVMIAEAYYTTENGMMVTVEVANRTETEHRITTLLVTLYNKEDGMIAKGGVGNLKKDFVIPADDSKQIKIYLGPEYVHITDDPLETLRWDVEFDAPTEVK